MPESVQTRLDEFFAKETEENRFSGTVLVAEAHETLFLKSYGFADHQRLIPNDPGRLYRIGSLTKAFVCFAIQILQERCYLDTSRTVSAYFPDAPHASRITLHQLMTHTSGLWCYLQDPNSPFWDVMDVPHTTDRLLGYMANRPLEFTPGCRYKYSNSSYVILGILIEQITQVPLGEFLSHEIFEPLGLRNTYFDLTGQIGRERLAIGYDHFSVSYPPKIPRNLHASVVYASGAMLSTVEDLLVWDKALYGNELISDASLTKLLMPNRANYACGWWVDKLQIGTELRPQVWHWGVSSGYHAMFNRFVDDKVTFIILQNMTSPDLDVPESPNALFRIRDAIASDVFDVIFAA